MALEELRLSEFDARRVSDYLAGLGTNPRLQYWQTSQIGHAIQRLFDDLLAPCWSNEAIRLRVCRLGDSESVLNPTPTAVSPLRRRLQR